MEELNHSNPDSEKEENAFLGTLSHFIKRDLLVTTTLLLAMATFLMAYFIWKQTHMLQDSVYTQRESVGEQKRSVDTQEASIKLQVKELSLSKRPYVYTEINDVSIASRLELGADGRETAHYMLQAAVEFKNEGVIPAIISDIRYFVTTDEDKGHLDAPKYFTEELGSFPRPTVIFPKQESLKFNYAADCSPSTERIYFNIVISYKGHEEEKYYWYSFVSKYAAIEASPEQVIEFADGGRPQVMAKVFRIIPLEIKGDWDRDKYITSEDVPEVYKPNRQVEEEQIMKQREFFKLK